MAYDDWKNWVAEKKWIPKSSEFNAILGTPNAISSVYLLIDHLDQIEKTIDSIKAEDKDIYIKYKSISNG